MRRFLVCSCTGALWVWPCLADAGSPQLLEYRTDAGCPNRDDFLQQLLSRSRSVEALSQTQIRVTIVTHETGYLGRLDLLDPHGNRVLREFSGPSCVELTQAIALVAAVTVDGATTTPTASEQATTRVTVPTVATASASEPRPSPAVANAAQPQGSAAAAAATPAAAPKEVAPPNRAAAPRDMPAPNRAAAPRDMPAPNRAAAPGDVSAPPKPEGLDPARSSRTPRFALGASGGLYYGIAPHTTPTLGLAFSYRPSVTWGSPELRVSALIAHSSPHEIDLGPASQGSAEFTWLSSRVLACPWEIGLSKTRLAPCAALEFGLLRGSGKSNATSGSSTGWWFAPGAALSWTALVGPLVFHLTGGGSFPLAREHFKFRPDLEAFRPPALGYVADLGVAWTFD